MFLSEGVMDRAMRWLREWFEFEMNRFKDSI
jgi:hypothetical protein